MLMDDDDVPIGRILDRREVVRLLALGGAAMLVGCRPRPESVAMDSNGILTGTAAGEVALPQCVAKPELTVGPYFVDKQLERSDVRESKPGAPLHLTFNVQRIGGNVCAPLAGAMVDIWQCDAAGEYSGVADQMVGFNTTGQKFMRGYQVTDASGNAKFTTVYPGWYRGRAVHIHFKIRTPLGAALEDQQDKTYEFTSQVFFDDKLTDVVHAKAPYAAKGQRDLRNANDGIYRQAGDSLLLAVKPSGDGYEATFTLGLDLADTQVGRAERSGGPGRRGRGRGRGQAG